MAMPGLGLNALNPQEKQTPVRARGLGFAAEAMAPKSRLGLSEGGGLGDMPWDDVLEAFGSEPDAVASEIGEREDEMEFMPDFSRIKTPVRRLKAMERYAYAQGLYASDGGTWGEVWKFLELGPDDLSAPFPEKRGLTKHLQKLYEAAAKKAGEQAARGAMDTGEGEAQGPESEDGEEPEDGLQV